VPGDANLGDAADAASTQDVQVDAADDVPTDTRPPVYDPYFDPAMASPATAITAPSEQWTWVGFNDAVCANGTGTGIGVNLTTRSSRALIFLMGGGACCDQATCYVVGTASNLDGYGETDFQSEIRGIGSLEIFDRSNANNPFRDYSYVFVPYCTGDAHDGNKIRFYNYQGTSHPTFFMGGRNMDVYLRRLVPTFASSERVILSGSSAGGFGAALNWDRVQTAFGSVRVDVLDDSGPPIDGSRYATWASTWNLQFPADCTECLTTPGAALDYYATRFGSGDHRFALLSYLQDGTISGFYGYTGAEFQTQLETLTTTRIDPRPWIHYFYLPGTDHVMLTNLGLMGADGTTLRQFVQQMVTDDPAWANVHP
jgi:hypothetical protein